MDLKWKRGFSLLELLVVVVLIIILTSLYWGANTDSREKRRQKACQANLERIFMAMQIYANDQAGKFPFLAGARTSSEALSLLIPRYTVETSIFICPASKDSPLPESEPFTNRPISYAYYMGRCATNSQVLLTDRQVDTLAKRAGQLLFSDTGKPPADNHGKSGGNLLFCDGHIEAAPPRAPLALDLPSGTSLLNPTP